MCNGKAITSPADTGIRPATASTAYTPIYQLEHRGQVSDGSQHALLASPFSHHIALFVLQKPSSVGTLILIPVRWVAFSPLLPLLLLTLHDPSQG